jgi:dTDP-4-dehydrorhamnose 3,5-epimerase
MKGVGMIDGVRVKKLKVIPDERGRLMEILRNDDEMFDAFGQVYMTTAYPGVVKGWHYHKKQYDNMAVVKGMMKIVLYDARDGSKTRGEVNEFFAGEHNPVLIHIPPFVYHGFKCISEEEAIVVNTTTEVYRYDEPDEFRVDPHANDIPYDWKRKDG